MKLPRLALVALFTLFWGLACSGLGALQDLDLSGTPPPSAAYEGVWEGPGLTVVIQSDGMVAIEQRGDHTQSIQAPAQAWRADGFDVGIGAFITTYALQEPPHEVEGRWRMVIEGVMLERIGDAPAPTPTFGQLGDELEAQQAPPEAATPEAGDPAVVPEAPAPDAAPNEP